jgi:hypothetical protein
VCLELRLAGQIIVEQGLLPSAFARGASRTALLRSIDDESALPKFQVPVPSSVRLSCCHATGK